MDMHPDDILVFTRITERMRQVASEYNLPLKSVTHLPMPKNGMADRMGDCSHTGDIRLVLRCTENGVWCEAPMSPKEIADTAAHELAHLRYMNHGAAFWAFHAELKEAMQNKEPDHKQKLIGKLVKMQASRESEAQIGNSEAAEAFASAINRMLIENELQPSDLDYAKAADSDPVIEVRCDLSNYPMPSGEKLHGKKTRIAWQESLARVVANAHLCTFLIQLKSNNITFVGTRSHVLVAEYCYGNLVRAATQMSEEERMRYFRANFKPGQGLQNHEKGFRAAWLSAFVNRISERLDTVRKAAVAQAPEGSSQALMRLSGAMLKAQRYIDDRFKSAAKGLQGPSSYHAEGRRMGREAADRMNIGQRGVNGGSSKGYLGS